MKKHTTQIILGLLLFALVAPSCYKPEKYNENKAVINPVIARYFSNFKTGSYWIFKSNTGVYDTVSVKQYRNQEPNLVILLHSNLGKDYVLNASYNEFFVRYYLPTSTGNNHTIVADPVTNEIIENTKSSKATIEKLSLLEVNNKVYADVIKSTDALDPQFSEYYFAPEVGIIKKVSADGNTVYTLVDSKIQ